MFNTQSKTICFIPARQGSTRLYNKNLKKIKNLSLTEITIKKAKRSRIFKDIILSSDSEKILNIGRKYNLTCHKRSRKNSTKFSKTDSALKETIKKLSYDYEYIVILQVTSPLRKIETIKKFVNFCIKKKFDTCLTVSLFQENIAPYNNQFFNPLLKKRSRSQDRKKYIYENGCIYFISRKYFKKNMKIFSIKNWNYFITNKYESIDIDDFYDYKISKILYDRV